MDLRSRDGAAVCSRTALCLFILIAITGLSLAQTAPGDFTIVALPDTQFYSSTYPQIFASQTQWIAAHLADQNIKLVLGLGDIVDGGGEIGQWQNADAAYRLIDRKVPFMPAIGNHDYDANNPPGRTASSVNYNSFFGPQRFADRTWYKGQFPAGSNENFYGTFNLAGRDYLVVVLEVFPRDAALNWAAGIIAANPTRDVIIVTHAYTYYDDTRMDYCDLNSAASFGAGADNDGQQIWEKLVSRFPNIVMVLSGHVVQGDGTGRRTDFGVKGNIVNQILSDYQSWPNGGNGYLRLITVSPSTNQVRVRTYSPFLDQFLTDDHNQFTLPYKSPVPNTPQVVTGVVRNAFTCAPMASTSITGGGTSAIAAADGTFSLSLPGAGAFPLQVTRSGYLTSKNGVTASADGQRSPVKALMSTAGIISGKVTSRGVPLGGATINFSGGALRNAFTVKTAADGSFSTSWIAIGTYMVNINTAALTYSGTVNVTTGQTSTVQLGN
jgi:hypothetical protein